MLLPKPKEQDIYIYVDANKRLYYVVVGVLLIFSTRIIITNTEPTIMNLLFLLMYIINIIYVGFAAIIAVITPTFDLKKHNILKELYELKFKR
jgi:hypothetical protein